MVFVDIILWEIAAMLDIYANQDDAVLETNWKISSKDRIDGILKRGLTQFMDPR